MYEYIQKAYCRSFNIGERVVHEVTRLVGTVTKEDKTCSHYVMVKFDGRRFSSPCHPQELEKHKEVGDV